MKFIKITSTLVLLAAMLALTACNDHDEPNDTAAQMVTFRISENAFCSESRASDQNYMTGFTAGDECGLYVVRNGNMVYENVKLTATVDGDAFVWQPETGVIVAGGIANEQYFLYYPYQADISGMVSATAKTDTDFFAPLISGWTVRADQRSYADYTASDLMTAIGSATLGTGGKLQITFGMTHRMALAVMEMPKTLYKFTNTDITISDYTVVPSVDFTGSDVRPYSCASGTYRFIVNPAIGSATSIIGSYANGDKMFTITPADIKAGSYRTYRVDGAATVEKEHELRPGDYLLSDGSIIGKDKTLTSKQKDGCVAIVFYAGQHEKDASDYSATAIGSEKCHGYAVALKDATSDQCLWGDTSKELGCYPKDVDGNAQNNYGNDEANIDWSGYSYTQMIIKSVGGKDKLNAIEEVGYPATYYAVVEYENNIQTAPANSSGWFLPSIGQIWDIYQNRTSLFDGKEDLTDFNKSGYWASSEISSSPAANALCVRVTYGWVGGDYKGGAYEYVRSILAF